MDALQYFRIFDSSFVSAVSGVILYVFSGILDSVSSVSYLFSVAKDCEPCPGSQFSPIASAWANIGYMTHADMLYLVSFTKFGLWGPLLFAAAAIGALVGVAINTPPRTYMWFMLGPAIFSFLTGTTQKVRGVDWTVAGEPQDMAQVWRDAETGMANTELVRRLGITVKRDKAPTQEYDVATGMLFFDELFSTSTNILVKWSGLYNLEGNGSADSNLAKRDTGIGAEGPWYLLSNMKWGMLENMVGVTARSANVRDALVTFLGSECGDAFKLAINDGAYMAASQSRGAVIPLTVFETGNGDGENTFNGDALRSEQYQQAVQDMDVTSLPTPRALRHLFEDKQLGGFARFMDLYDARPGSPSPFQTAGRDQSIVCSEYLYTLIQALRWEAGHSYHQLIRSSPRGLNRQQFLDNLFYGWDIRARVGEEYAKEREMVGFVKMVILSYMFRNELLYAPPVTKTNGRFSPSDQARSYSEAYVRTIGSKSKFAEIYQWAVMMPHIQGILLYLILASYPFVCMVMIIPGYWKGFFTWVAFFAWVKIWDIGFAVVQVLERSVWAMIGNSSNSARIAQMLIQTADQAGSIGVSCADGSDGMNIQKAAPGQDALQGMGLEGLCPVPRVCSVTSLDIPCNGTGAYQEPNKAWFLLDKILLVGSGLDLDVANGYYVYIMSALYFAVPAVTGQFVLGAKAGAASMVGSMISPMAGEAGKAAGTGYQHQAVAAAQTNRDSLAQAAYGKAMRTPGNMAAQALDAQNRSLDMEAESGLLRGKQNALKLGAEALGNVAKSHSLSNDLAASVISSGADAGRILGAPFARMLGTAKSGTGGGTGTGELGAFATVLNNAGLKVPLIKSQMSALGAEVNSSANGANLQWDQDRLGMMRSGLNAMPQRLQAGAEYQASMAAWEAKNEFAAHVSSAAGIAGMNAGNLAPGQKPADYAGMGMNGDLGSSASSRLSYAGSGFQSGVISSYGQAKASQGGSWYLSNWGGGKPLSTLAANAQSVYGEFIDGAGTDGIFKSAQETFHSEVSPLYTGEQYDKFKKLP
jgi:hypothetical protein